MPFAFVRLVADSFAAAISSVPPADPINVVRAREQHADYVRALTSIGLTVMPVPADERCPDCCFIEDTAVVVGRTALITHSAAAARVAEAEAVAAALAPHCEIIRMQPPATLDGGDCLEVGGVLYIGQSERTNDAGIIELAHTFGRDRVVPVPVPPGFLHLKSCCSALDEETVVVAEGRFPDDAFPGVRRLVIPRDEELAANLVVHGRAAVIAASFPKTTELLEAAGTRCVPVNTSEMRKADGALTCLSVLVSA